VDGRRYFAELYGNWPPCVTFVSPCMRERKLSNDNGSLEIVSSYLT
jgi:hypothetical protein